MENTTNVITLNSKTLQGDLITSFEHIGMELAKQLYQVDNQANVTKRELILNTCSNLQAGHSQEFLNGYALALKESNLYTAASVDSRKSELKAVYNALYIKADSDSKNELLAITDWNILVKACRSYNSQNILPSQAEQALKLANEKKALAKIEADNAIKADNDLRVKNELKIIKAQAKVTGKTVKELKQELTIERDSLLDRLYDTINELAKFSELDTLINDLKKVLTVDLKKAA